MPTENGIAGVHLTDDEFAALAVPSAAALEPLPAHLSECLQCSRALAEWKSALADIGAEDEEVLSRRSEEEWRAAEDATLAKIGRAGAAGHGRTRTLRWALPLAASLLLFALLIGNRPTSAPVAFDDTTGFSAQDRADDALLRDVDRLARGDDPAGGWGSLAPDPISDESVSPAEQRS
ncbi:MAG TPA: hypothetical protein VKS03_01315 [Thermoanaerobaculia bacterium]|nr:hypothetical protein [Thermoanaerobaculia bacterium]